MLGEGFINSPELLCRVAGSSPTRATWINSSSILCSAPARRPGLSALEISNNDGHTWEGALQLEYLPALTVQSVTPSILVSSKGGDISVSGTGFQAHRAMACRIGRAVVAASVINSSSLVCAAPTAVEAGVSRAVVGVGFSGLDTVPFVESDLVSVAYTSVPTVVRIAPNSGAFEGGTRVSLVPAEGQAFQSEARGMPLDWECMFMVEAFPGTATNVPLAQSAGQTLRVAAQLDPNTNQLHCVTPPISRGPRNAGALRADVRVAPAGTGMRSLAPTGLTFTYTVGLLATSVVPAIGPETGGFTVSVSGRGFEPRKESVCGFRPAGAPLG